MNKKDLKKLSRNDLLELYLGEREENEKLQAENERLKKELEDKKLNITKFGTMAEAALSIAGVFEACDRACAIYRENYLEGISSAYSRACDILKDLKMPDGKEDASDPAKNGEKAEEAEK